MRNVWLGLLGVLALNWSCLALAQDGADEDDEINVDADSMEMQIDERGNVLFLEGNVRLADSQWSMEANKLTIHMKKGGLNLDELSKKRQKDSGEASSDESRKEEGKTADEQDKKKDKEDDGMSFKSVEAVGGVVIRTLKGSETAYGDSAYFDVKSRIVTLQGNCEIRQDKHILRGEKVEFDVQKQTFKLTAFKGRISLKKDGKGGNPFGGLFSGGSKDKGKEKANASTEEKPAAKPEQKDTVEQDKR